MLTVAYKTPEESIMLIITYILYLSISIGITIWVGQSLHKNGRVFLVENFRGNEQVADSINHLLLVGFYLINIGFISLILKYGQKPVDVVGMIEFLSGKIGGISIVLGIMHFFNMHYLSNFRDSAFFKAIAGTKEQPATGEA